MKLHFRLLSFVVACFMCASPFFSGCILAAENASYNWLGYEIAQTLLSDDFDDGLVSDNYKLCAGHSGSGNLSEDNGQLLLAKSDGTSGYITCNIALDPDASAITSGQYFFEMDITKPAGGRAYIWLSHLSDIADTASTDFVRTRFTDEGFTDDKSGATYSVDTTQSHHVSFLADIDEGTYSAWIDGNPFISDSSYIYASNEGINSIRLVLPAGGNPSVAIDNLKVYKIALSDELSVLADTNSLTIDDLVRKAVDETDLSVINDDLYLPKTLRNGSSVEWITSNDKVISIDGSVSVVSEPTEVTLTAVISKGVYSQEKKFVFTVVPPTARSEVEYEILSTIFEDDFDDGILKNFCSHSDEPQSVFSEKNGALQLAWNSTIPATAKAAISLPKGVSLSKNSMICIEVDVKKTSKATAVFEISGTDASYDIVRFVFADGKLYDEAKGADNAISVSNGYFNHITVLYEPATGMYYSWINGELHSYFMSALYPADSVGNFQFSLKGGKGAHFAAVDNLSVYLVDAEDYLDAQSRVRFLEDEASLTVESLTNESPDNIKMSLNLISKTDNGSTVTWETSDSYYIDKSGRVTRPRENEENKKVILTATISHGGYCVQKQFEFVVCADEPYFDPNIMTDEELFGVWDRQDNAFLTYGKIDYSYSDKLKPTLECVKKGDYEGAKAALLEYFRNRKATYTLDSSKRNVFVANLFADGWMFSGHNYYAGDMFAEQSTAKSETNILVEHIIPGDYNSLNVAAYYNEASWCEIYGANASVDEWRPKLEVVVDGKTKVYEAIDDAIIRAGSYMETHCSSNNEILKIRKFGEYLCNEEYNALFKFDLRDLDVSSTIEKAKLILTCRTDTDNPEGKRLFVMREPTSTWSGSDVRWCDVNGYTYSNVGLTENRNWDQWAPYCNTEYGKQINRFFPVTTTMLEYRMTKDEYYAYSTLRAIGDYINDFGSWSPTPEPQTFGHFDYDDINDVSDTTIRGQYPRTLDAHGRLLQLSSVFDLLCDSESVTPEYSTAILKHIWDIAHSLRVYHTLLRHNWQMIEMQGMYEVAQGFPEFRDAVGDDGEDWRTYGFRVLEDYIVDGYLEDGTYGEDTGGYSQNVLKSFSAIVTQMKKDNYTLKPENRFKLQSATYFNLLLRTPDGSALAYGDEPQNEGNAKGETYPAFSLLFNDNELKYVDSFGRYGTEPTWTSRHYPVGKTTFMRSNWSSNSPYLFTVNRGDVDPSHSHCDDNSVVVYAYGNTLLSDQGVFNYDSTPEKLWGISSEGHNTVTINDKNQVSNITNGHTHQWTAGTGFDFLRQSAYTNIGYDHQRSIFFSKPAYTKTNYWIVSDLMLADDKSQQNNYKQHWHMRPDAYISGDAAERQIYSNFAEGGNVIVASADNDAALTLKDGYWSYNYGNATETKWGYFEKASQGDATMNTVILPYENSDASVSAVKIPIDAPQTSASALKINISANGEILEDYYYVSYEADAQPRSFGDYSTDGNVAFVSTNGDGDIRQISLTNGTYMKHNGVSVIDTTDDIDDINVEISDGTVYIGSSDNINLSSLSLNLGIAISNVYFNGQKMSFNAENGIISISGTSSSDDTGFIGQGVVDRDDYVSGSSSGNSGGSTSGGISGGGVGVNNGQIFTDIIGHWAESIIANLHSRGIIKGKTANTYCPEDKINRAEAVTLLMRMMDAVDSSYVVLSFDDVNETDWFCEDVKKAYAMGIISADTAFRPYDPITRQEMAKLVVNVCEIMSSSVISPQELSFSDVSSISDWAIPFVSKAVGAGLVKGMDDGSFLPNRNVTRAEAAAFISRLN